LLIFVLISELVIVISNVTNILDPNFVLNSPFAPCVHEYTESSIIQPLC